MSQLLFEHKDIEKEFLRWWKSFDEKDPYTTPQTLGLFDVLKSHFLIIDYFYGLGSGIGGIGPRDKDLLESAIYRQFVSFGDKEKWKTNDERCATLVYGLVKDHPFHDANKRTALLVLLFYLDKNNFIPTVKQKELEDFVVRIAENKLDRYKRFHEIKKKIHNDDDSNVYFIADYIRRNRRGKDKRNYLITYMELEKILQRFGYFFCDPGGNSIHICKKERIKKIFRKPQEKIKHVLKIGFPGYKKQVSKQDIKKIRDVLGLTADNGYDSQVFYKSEEPLYSLINEYKGPLQRLANR